MTWKKPIRNSKIEVNLGTSKKKEALVKLAHDRGYNSVSDMVRLILIRYIDEAPEPLKRPIPLDG